MLNYCKNNKYLILISLLWIILWASLNSFPSDFNFIEKTFSEQISLKNYIIEIINIIRFYLPIILSNFLIIILIIKNINFNEKISRFLLLVLVFFISQFLGLIFTNLENLNLERTFLLLLSFNGLGILYLANIYLNINHLKKIFYINILFLIFILILYLPIIYKDFFNSPFLLLYNTRTWNELYFDDPIIRVTGLSRVLALITIIFLVKLNNGISKKNLIPVFILLLLGTNIWGLQSRLVLLTIGVIIIINLFLFSKDKFFQNLFCCLFIIIFSILSFKFIQSGKLYYLEKVKPELVSKYNYDLKFKKNRIEEVISRINDNEVNEDEMIYITSGRNLIWKKIIKSYDYNKIFGYGPQADRYELLKQDFIDINDSGYMTNSSSAFFYSFICGGYFGLLIFILINLYILKLLYEYLKIRYFFYEEKFYTDTLFLIIIYLQIRSLFENSYSVFSLDFLIMVSAVTIFEKMIKLRQKNKI